MVLAQETRLFQHPDDFTALKQVRRTVHVPFIFVAAHSEHFKHLARRNRFPVYASMDALAEAVAQGQVLQYRVMSKTPESIGSPKQTVPPSHLTPSARYKDVPTQDDTPTMPLPVVPPSPVQLSYRKHTPSRFPRVLIATLLLALTSVWSGSVLMSLGKLPTLSPVAPQVVGHLYFLSSDQLSENSSQGICDQVQLDLDHLAAPTRQKRYYAWLLHDLNQSEATGILLGPLQINQGTAHLFYSGSAQHSNLLAMTSRVLITEEDADVIPTAPSPDERTWRYYGEFAQSSPSPVASAAAIPGMSHPSYLDHLRSLLASDSMLDQMELPGGFTTWLYRNTGQVLEWASSIRGNWEEHKDVGFLRSQAARILVYLDGMSYVHQDLPSGTLPPVNERLARVGLLTVQGTTQDPISYIGGVVLHLYGLINTSPSPGPLRIQADKIITALSNVQFWLGQTRQVAQQLLSRTDTQLLEPDTLTLINKLIELALDAYVGHTDPVSRSVHPGVIWIHDSIQALATLDITAYMGNGLSIQMIQDMHHPKAVRPFHEEETL
jgi:hypothetical protein